MPGKDGAERPWQRGGRAIDLEGEPQLVYHPVVDLMTGRLLGFEALLRWQHPTQGLIPPGVLIPAAEANGDIVALGEWILVEGCRQAMEWPSSIQLAVNCSPVQLIRGMASRSAQIALEETGLPVDRLTIEATERALSDQAAAADLRAMVALGVQVAVDDAGTSINSFEQLHNLNVNTVKIDRSFISGLEAEEGINRMVVEQVVRLAQSSGMAVIAEGVETELHCSVVREFQADAAQGYYFSPPLSPEAATTLANKEDLAFPLTGPGWYAGGTSPVDGLVDETLRVPKAPPRKQVSKEVIDREDAAKAALENALGAAEQAAASEAQAKKVPPGKVAAKKASGRAKTTRK